MLAGAVIGLVVAYASGRAVSSWLYEVRASDPIILGAATLLGHWHRAGGDDDSCAYRAGRLDPAKVLRPE